MAKNAGTGDRLIDMRDCRPQPPVTPEIAAHPTASWYAALQPAMATMSSTPWSVDSVEQSGAALWVHSHTHNQVDYQIGQTRDVANCLGYEFDIAETAGFCPDLVVDV